MRSIYKVVSDSEWNQALAVGAFKGAAIDLSDGFIHFSSAQQVVETVAKHFHGQDDLLLLEFDADQLGDDLRWEVSRGGDLFPHLYGILNTADLVSKATLKKQPDGSHTFPDGFV